ncbi:hypothetical protein P20652_2404 [Pseudoalteromonas sp. BSi20652]|nr:hypothetical protein P20652_2404 [Pseudoalteromonas sp. BSi20652]
MCLLARIQIPFDGFVTDSLMINSVVIDGAQLFVLASVVYYFMLSFSLGFIMAVIFTLLLVGAQPIAAMAFWPWLSIGVGVFVFGWVLQFIGHYYEGKKPAFVDDLIGLIIGPLYVTVELLFLMGFYKTLEDEVNAIAGPTKA